jgi:hypothetical protein
LQDDQLTKLEHNTGIVETDRILPENHLAGNDNNVDKLLHIKDTFTTLSSVNPDRYNRVYKMLLAYPEGSPLIVTYFHRNEPDIDIRSIPADISDTMHTVHKDFTEIRGLEMRLLGSINHTRSDEDNTYNLDGEALMYPGLEPRYSDMFFLDIGDGNIGIFTINHIEPTTYRQGSFFKVNFNLNCFADRNSYNAIKDAVRDVVYFDKRKYFGESELTFLETDSYKLLQSLRKLRKRLTQFYVNTYYSKEYESFMRPDNIYDPYVAEFMRKKISLLEHRIRPLQLYTRLRDYHKSIWYKFIDSEASDDFSDVVGMYHVRVNRIGAYDTDINGLANGLYVKLGTDGRVKEPATTHPYIFTEAFYQDNKDLMPDFDRFVYDYLHEKQISVHKVLEYANKYRTVGLDNGFYFIPLYIELVDIAIQSIR